MLKKISIVNEMCEMRYIAVGSGYIGPHYFQLANNYKKTVDYRRYPRYDSFNPKQFVIEFTNEQDDR